MSRACYSDDLDQWDLIRWRGAVKSAIRGKRGQALLVEMLAAFDAMPSKRLVKGALEEQDEVCALGGLGRARGVDMSKIDPEDYEQVAGAFNVAEALAREIEYENDEGGHWQETPEARFERVRAWVVSQIKVTP